MTLVGRSLVARKQVMSAMMPSDARNYALLIKAFKHTHMLVRLKKPFLASSLHMHVQGKDTKIISVEVVVYVLLTVTSTIINESLGTLLQFWGVFQFTPV